LRFVFARILDSFPFATSSAAASSRSPSEECLHRFRNWKIPPRRWAARDKLASPQVSLDDARLPEHESGAHDRKSIRESDLHDRLASLSEDTKRTISAAAHVALFRKVL
jgi:hypothetical protein